MSYQETHCGRGSPYVKMQWVYASAPADWAVHMSEFYEIQIYQLYF